MVDSTLQLPQEGTGPKTPAIQSVIGANTIKVPISLIAGFKTYVTAVMNSASAANKNHLILFNGIGSGRVVRIWDIKVNPNITAAVAGTSIVLNTARISDVGTAGASAIIRKTDTSDNNLPVEITSRTSVNNPTVSSNELASCTVLIEETAAFPGQVNLYKADSVISSLVLNEGEGLLVQQGTFAGVGAINVFIYFTID
jgi:hypothetical protein